MAAIVWTDVVAIAPELTSTVVQAQTDILAHVNTVHNAVNWGGEAAPRLRLARIYLAAHAATSISRGDVAGPVLSQTDGRLAQEYAFPRYQADPGLFGSDLLLDSTTYGREYRQLMRSNGLVRGPAVL